MQINQGESVPSDKKESENTFEEELQWSGLEFSQEILKKFFLIDETIEKLQSFFIFIQAVTYLQFLFRLILLVLVEKQFLAVTFYRFFSISIYFFFKSTGQLRNQVTKLQYKPLYLTK